MSLPQNRCEMASIVKLRTKQRLKNMSKNKGGKSQSFEVRDLREREFFTVDDAFLDGKWLRILKGVPAAVYFALCRHADKAMQAFPSVQYLSDSTGYCPRQVRRGLQILEFHQLITVNRERGYHNIYSLFYKKHWRKMKSLGFVAIGKGYAKQKN